MENIKKSEIKKCPCRWCNKIIIVNTENKIDTDKKLKEQKIKDILYSV